MSIQIVDNFKVNVAKPIDSRMVTNGLAERNSLENKYEGLRVYDISDNKAYVYKKNSSSVLVWEEESGGSSSGGGSGNINITGTQYSLLYFSTSNTIGNSAIIDNSSNPATPKIGIGQAGETGFGLVVKGNIKSTQGFSGSGATLTSLNGNNIQPKTINNTKITAPGPVGYILKSTSATDVNWVADLNTSIVVAKEASSTSVHYLLFSNSYDGLTPANILANYYDSSRYIGIKPSTSQILGSGNLVNGSTLPTYAFINNLNGGLYGNSGEIGLSFNSKALLKLNNTQISLFDTNNNSVLSTGIGLVNFGTGAVIKSQTTSSVTSPDYTWTGDLTTGMYRPATNQVALTTNGVARFTVTNTLSTISTPTTISGATTLSSTLAVTGATTLSSTLVVSGYTSIQNQLTVNTSQAGVPAFFINNPTGFGIQANTNGEFFKSVQNNGINLNYMSFYKDISTRRGYIGYGSSTAGNDDLAINNETTTGSISLRTNGSEMLNISTNTLKLKSSIFADLTNVKLKLLYSNNEFNFINNDTFNSNPIYFNYRGALTNGVTGYRFHNGKEMGGSDGLVPIYTGGLESYGPVKIGSSGTIIKQRIVGYIAFKRSSNGGGFSVVNKSPNVVSFSDVSGSGSSFQNTTGWLKMNVEFSPNTFKGTTAIITSNFGPGVHGNALYYSRHLFGELINVNTLQIFCQMAALTDTTAINYRFNFCIDEY